MAPNGLGQERFGGLSGDTSGRSERLSDDPQRLAGRDAWPYASHL